MTTRANRGPRHAKFHLPCGHLADDYTDPTGKGNIPEDGDLSICLVCGSWQIFVVKRGKIVAIRAFTAEDFLRFSDEDLGLARDVTREINRHHGHPRAR